VLAGSVSGQQDPIDFTKAQQLRKRQLKGEKLSDEETAYLEKAKAAFQKKQAQGKGEFPEAKATWGLTPLCDIGAGDRYKDQDGGLYGEGRNEPPEAHARAALKIAREIVPRDRDGHPADGGKIVVVSIGMSNTTQEFQAFMRLARDDAGRAREVVLVDGAQGGMEASTWADPAKVKNMGRPDPWEVLAERLRQAQVSHSQVQVVWLKQARANPAALGAFPKHAEQLCDDVAVCLRRLKSTLPNLRIAYLSSRIYAGYASTPLNPEPYAYEGAFSFRWLVRDQVAGRGDLEFDPARGEVKAPLLLWGPYLWADGTSGRKADDLVWTREDLAGDGTHPSADGQRKVARLLLDFFHKDATASVWYLRPTDKGH
jgi:hypothetical protein